MSIKWKRQTLNECGADSEALYRNPLSKELRQQRKAFNPYFPNKKIKKEIRISAFYDQWKNCWRYQSTFHVIKINGNNTNFSGQLLKCKIVLSYS